MKKTLVMQANSDPNGPDATAAFDIAAHGYSHAPNQPPVQTQYSGSKS